MKCSTRNHYCLRALRRISAAYTCVSLMAVIMTHAVPSVPSATHMAKNKPLPLYPSFNMFFPTFFFQLISICVVVFVSILPFSSVPVLEKNIFPWQIGLKWCADLQTVQNGVGFCFQPSCQGRNLVFCHQDHSCCHPTITNYNLHPGIMWSVCL